MSKGKPKPPIEPSISLFFGPDGKVAREEIEGELPPYSDDALISLANILLDYLDRKGIYKPGSADPFPEPPAGTYPAKTPGAAPAELTVKQAAELLGVSVTTVRRRITAGSLTARNAAEPGAMRPNWRIPAEAVFAVRGG